MRLQTIERNVETTGVLSEGDFGISADDQAHVLTILRDKLYSDKFAAIVREYCTNAWDAHMEAGIADRPIKVQCPTRWEPIFSIRDYGKGLTREEVYNVYTKYGRSTKRNSNDVIGQLGLGCKSGFAYSNTFTIISYCNGLKTTYVAFIDQSGVGKVNELQSVPSDETGIEIQIAIRAADVEIIKERIQKLFPYFDPIPDCNLTIARPEYSAVSQLAESHLFWAIRTDYGQGPCAIMGNIPYPIDVARLPELNESGKELLQCGIDVRFPIGELSISASREALEYTDNTRQAIYKRIAVIRNEILASLKTQFDQCQNVWEARMLFQRTQRTGTDLMPRVRMSSYGYSSRNIVATLAATAFKSWNGKDISCNDFSFESNKGDKLEIRLLDSSSKRATDKETSSYKKRVALDQRLIILKNNVKTAWLKRVLSWRETNKATDERCFNILVVDWKGEDLTGPEYDLEITRYLEANGLTGIRIISAADIPLPEETAQSTDGSTPKRPVNTKAKAKVFTLIPSYVHGAYPASQNWTPAEADLEEGSGIYVEIHGFLPVEIDSTSPQRSQILYLLHSLGHDFTKTPVYGIRTEMKDKLGENWKELLTWGKDEAKVLLQNSPLRDSLINFYIANHFSLGRGTMLEHLKLFLDSCGDNRLEKACAIIVAAETQQKNLDYTSRQKLSTILQHLKGDIMGQISTSIKIIEDIEEDYPLLKDLQFFQGGIYLRNTTWPASLAQYVQLMYAKK